VRDFYEASIQPLMRLPHLPDDFHMAARIIGEAIFDGAARPSFADGLIAACARRTNRVVWTTDESDFKAMGCQTFNPWKVAKEGSEKKCRGGNGGFGRVDVARLSLRSGAKAERARRKFAPI